MSGSVEKVAVTRDTYTRYNASERANHWVVAVCAILLTLSGLAFFHPAFYWLTALFGGGQAARVLHPWIGVVMAISFTGMGVRMFCQNIWNADDSKWLGRIGDVIANRDENLPEVGRFNAAQKLVFYVMFWSVITLFLSGLALWHQYFGDLVPIGMQRFAGLLHAVTAAAMIITMIIHIYAAIWNAGSTRAMTRGSVTGGWLWRHHRKYLREEVAKSK